MLRLDGIPRHGKGKNRDAISPDRSADSLSYELLVDRPHHGAIFVDQVSSSANSRQLQSKSPSTRFKVKKNKITHRQGLQTQPKVSYRTHVNKSLLKSPASRKGTNPVNIKIKKPF